MKPASKLLICLFFYAACLNSMENANKSIDPANDPKELLKTPMFKTFTAIGSIGTSFYLTSKLEKTGLFKKGCEKVNVSPQDASNVLGISMALLSAANTAEESLKQGLRHFGLRAPLAGLLTWLTIQPCVKEYFSHWPLIGKFLHCSNKDCPGACQDCKLTTGILLVGTYTIVSKLCDCLAHVYGSTF